MESGYPQTRLHMIKMNSLEATQRPIPDKNVFRHRKFRKPCQKSFPASKGWIFFPYTKRQTL